MAQQKKSAKKYTPAQKVKYHNSKAKVGATKTVNVDGKKETRKLSDFERGRHKEKADSIVKARMRTFKKHNNGFAKQGKLDI